MASKLFNMFRKKPSNKENEPELDRDMSYRRSTRSTSGAGGSTGKSSHRSRTTRFEFPDDRQGFISATAPYHTETAPKLYRGPVSCPGGYRNDDYREDLNPSFDNEFHRGSRRQQRDRERPEKHYKVDKYRASIRDTSEYGSGDPSPIGNLTSRHSHYNEQLQEDSENEEYGGYSDEKKIKQLEDACNNYRNRVKITEQRALYYKNKFKSLSKNKDQIELAFTSQIEKKNEEINKLKKHNADLVSQMQNMGMGRMGGSHYQGMPGGYSHHPSGFGGGYPGQMGRFSMMPPMPSNTATPVTSVLSNVSGADRSGTVFSNASLAGEALTEMSDLSSCVQNNNLFESSLVDHLEEVSSAISSDCSPKGGYFRDEVKKFTVADSDESLEMPRAQNESSSSIGYRHNTTVELHSERQDDAQLGSSSTVVQSSDLTARRPKLRRSASDTRPQPLRLTTL